MSKLYAGVIIGSIASAIIAGAAHGHPVTTTTVTPQTDPDLFGIDKPVKKDPPVVITFNPGGSVGEFIEQYEEIAKRNQKVIVKGECISACTLMIGIVPPQNVCVTPEAMFAFHSATEEDPTGKDVFSKQGTEIIFYSYPVPVRELLTKAGMGPDTPHPDLIWFPGTTFYQLCK